jgi:hypothetical protein
MGIWCRSRATAADLSSPRMSHWAARNTLRRPLASLFSSPLHIAPIYIRNKTLGHHACCSLANHHHRAWTAHLLGWRMKMCRGAYHRCSMDRIRSNHISSVVGSEPLIWDQTHWVRSWGFLNTGHRSLILRPSSRTSSDLICALSFASSGWDHRIPPSPCYFARVPEKHRKQPTVHTLL